MALTIDTLRNLSGNGSVTFDLQNGAMKSGTLQKLRSFFNIGDARRQNADTLIAVHHAIANDPRFAAPDVQAEAARLLGQIRTDRAIGAGQIRTLVQTLDSLTLDTSDAVKSRVAARLAATMPPWAAGHEQEVLGFVEQHVVKGHLSVGSYTAIDVAGRMKEALDAVGAAIAHAGDDPVLKALILSSLDRTMLNGDGDLASAQKIRQRVDTFRADLAAVNARAQRSADPARTMEVGLTFIQKLGKPIDPRVLNVLDNFSRSLPVKALGALGPNSSGSEILLAIHRFAETVRTANVQYPAGVTPLNGGDELSPTQQYIINSAIAELPPAAQDSLLAALESKEGLNVCAYIASQTSCGSALGDYDAVGRIAEYLQKRAGKPVAYPGGFNRTPNIDGFSPLALCAFEPDHAISGDPNLAAPLRKAVLRPHRFDHSTYRGAAMHDKVDAGVKSLISGSFATEMKKLATGGDDTVFDKDIVRGIDVTLPDGTKLANDRTLARDQLARLVTGNAQATYATLSPGELTKTNAFMAILMQDTELAAERGIPLSLSSTRGIPAYSSVTGPGMQPTRAFEISGSPAEGFTIHHMGTYPAAILSFNDDKGSPMMIQMPEKKAIDCSYELEIHISPASLDKVAAEDWSQYDGTASDDILHHPEDHENMLADHYDAIPQNFRPDFEVSAGFSIKIGVPHKN